MRCTIFVNSMVPKNEPCVVQKIEGQLPSGINLKPNDKVGREVLKAVQEIGVFIFWNCRLIS